MHKATLKALPCHLSLKIFIPSNTGLSESNTLKPGSFRYYTHERYVLHVYQICLLENIWCYVGFWFWEVIQQCTEIHEPNTAIAAWPQHQRVTSAGLCAHLNHLGYPYPGWTMLVEVSSGSELSSSSAAARTGSTSTQVWAEPPTLLWLTQGDICALVRAFPPPADPLLIAVYQKQRPPSGPLCVEIVSFFAPAEVSHTHPALFPEPHCPCPCP